MAKKEENKKLSPDEKTFATVMGHYTMAKNDMETRKVDWEKREELFRSHIKESGWPFQSQVFDPRTFTIITEKTARTVATKPRGKVYPREGGDVKSARIVNELQSYQWDNARHEGTMLQKWALMDQWARKFGASFGLVRWWYEKKGGKSRYDAPEFIPINNRNALPDPNATSLEACRWFQVRTYPTLNELRRTNDLSRSEPIYDPRSIKIIRERMGKVTSASIGGDYLNKDRSISKLTDQSARDPEFKILRIVTEYQPERWITFAPDFGVILRDIPNPYEHGELPIVMLRYLPTGYDLYGLSEIEPMEKIQKAINAVLNQYLDTVTLELYPPLIINPSGVQNYLALEWAPGEPWLANNPAGDIRRLESSAASTIPYFTSTYSVLVSALMDAAGESGLGVSNQRPFEPGKTATEVQALAMERGVRDTYNLTFLSEALGRLARLWFLMNKQFIKKPEIIRIIGRDALASFRREPLNQLTALPVMVGGEEVPKLEMQEDFAFLAVEPRDLDGDFDFIYDYDSFVLPNERDRREAQRLAIELLVNNPNVLALLQQEGFQPKVKDLVAELLQLSGIKDSEQYFSTTSPALGQGGEGGVAFASETGAVEETGSLEGGGGIPLV